MTQDELIDELQAQVRAGEVSYTAIRAVVWLAGHREEAGKMLGVTPCGWEECASLIEALKNEGLDELAVFMAYKQFYLVTKEVGDGPG